MKNMMDITDKISLAEAKQTALLNEMNDIDKKLSGLSQADPGRIALKSRKAELLPLYRGARDHVKQLRRELNSLSSNSMFRDNVPQPSAAKESAPGPSKELLYDLYIVLAEALDDMSEQGTVNFKNSDKQIVRDFVEKMDEVYDE